MDSRNFDKEVGQFGFILGRPARDDLREKRCTSSWDRWIDTPQKKLGVFMRNVSSPIHCGYAYKSRKNPGNVLEE